MQYADVHDHLVRLKTENQDLIADRARIRAILNGGAQGIYAILAWNMGKEASMQSDISDIEEQFGVDLPTVNMMDSGLSRLAQKVGRAPTLKPPKYDSESVGDVHKRRIDVLRSWDEEAKVHMTYPQLGRWLPGYGFVFSKLTQRTSTVDGLLYPVTELRNPFDVYPGWLGPDQQPRDYCTVRRIPLSQLVEVFPEAADAAEVVRRLKAHTDARNPDGGGWSFHANGVRSWEGVENGVEVVEYESAKGRGVFLPEAEWTLSWTPNPIGMPMFSFNRRFTFDQPQSQYHHVIGLQAMQAKLNVLLIMALEDGVMIETNIEGPMDGKYEFGRDAVNYLEPGTKVNKPYPGSQNQTLQGINHLERSLRIGANYDVQQDGTSPNSFATGMGMRELQGAVTENVREYHVSVRDHAENNDRIRQAFAYEMYKTEKRTYYDMRGKKREATIANTFDGDLRSRRIFGAMATFDDHQKIIVGMQLETAGAIDMLTFQENIDGLEDLELINERITRKQYREVLKQRLLARSETDPTADELLVKIMQDPDNEMDLLAEYFVVKEEPEADPMAMMGMEAQAMAGQQGAPIGVPNEPIQSVLSRVEGSGAVDGGVQSVAVQ